MTDVREVSAAPFVEGLNFAEGPRWHEGRLWYSDFDAEAVFSVGVDGVPRREVDVPDSPSGLGWLPDGRLLVVAMNEHAVLRREPDGSLVLHADLRPWSVFRANDMIVDASGGAYVGNFGFDLDGFLQGDVAPVTTSLVRVDPDGTAHEAAADLRFPNGMVLTPDGRTLVVAESLGFQLTAFDVDADGSLSNRRVWASLEGCAPDGICLDADGCVWAANALGAECVRVAEGGEVVGRVVTSQPTFACMLGGPDRRTLYCCTAPTSESGGRPKGQGRIERVEVDAPGAGRP